jgi:hypothetical protein
MKNSTEGNVMGLKKHPKLDQNAEAMRNAEPSTDTPWHSLIFSKQARFNVFCFNSM